MPDLHCRHCGTGCTGGTDLGDGPNLHTDMSFAFWRDGHCPACAEAEQIEATRAEAYAEGAAAEREGIVEWLLRSADPGVRALADDVARLVP